MAASPHEGRVNITHQLVGCFPRSAGDTDDEIGFQDRKCVNLTNAASDGDGPCRSGLPFYRFALHKEQSFLDCFTFCLSKGLDLCGVVYSERATTDECRCGATLLNKGVWGNNTPDSRLLLAESSVPQDDERCKIVVWKYTGGFEDEEVPTPLVQMSASDEAYTAGIVSQVDPDTISDEGTPDEMDGANSTEELEVSLAQGLCQDNHAVAQQNGRTCAQVRQEGLCSYQDHNSGVRFGDVCPVSCDVCSAGRWRTCYPYACGPGGRVWPKSGNVVYVNYYFDGTLDQERRNKFRHAKNEWERKTCVRFNYSPSRPTIKVWYDQSKPGECSCTPGYPGRTGEVKLNWGSCLPNSAVKWGTAAHELGHALGMNHEHKRPDAAQSFKTPAGWKGPYVWVKWGHLNSNLTKQFAPATSSYIGSSNVGYADYDYESIMHYRKTNSFGARDPVWDSVIGQRAGLSDGDVRQFKDMYGC